MRFEDLSKFCVEDLLLDTGNYRFRAASDQKDCIKRIYNQNPDGFIRMMDNVGHKDIVQPLIVYDYDNKHIVMDGNRRIAALKVLYNAEEYSPASNLIVKAHELKNLGKAKFSEILAMCSSKEQEIEDALYDIHAAGGGISQIGWNAYANAIYRYKHGLEKGKKWYPTAVLLKIEDEFPAWSDFLTSESFYETFARIFKAALARGIISKTVFSPKGISDSVSGTLLRDLYQKSIKFLEAIKNKKISLSRDVGIYASKEGVETFLRNFKLSPDNERIQSVIGPHSAEGGEIDITKKGDLLEASVRGTDSTVEKAPKVGESGSQELEKLEEAREGRREYGIQRSEAIESKLKELGNAKLLNLYNSLCVVSLAQHPVLIYAGAWCFFEILARAFCERQGRSLKSSFDSYLDSQIKNNVLYTTATAENKKSIGEILTRLARTGNTTKHDADQYFSGPQLRTDFNTSKDFILDVLDMCIKVKEGEAK